VKHCCFVGGALCVFAALFLRFQISGTEAAKDQADCVFCPRSISDVRRSFLSILRSIKIVFLFHQLMILATHCFTREISIATGRVQRSFCNLDNDAMQFLAINQSSCAG
jgi:hypothetical protein